VPSAAKLLPDNLIDKDDELSDAATEEYRRALFRRDDQFEKRRR
jgi:hypothetical protein